MKLNRLCVGRYTVSVPDELPAGPADLRIDVSGDSAGWEYHPGARALDTTLAPSGEKEWTVAQGGQDAAEGNPAAWGPLVGILFGGLGLAGGGA